MVAVEDKCRCPYIRLAVIYCLRPVHRQTDHVNVKTKIHILHRGGSEIGALDGNEMVACDLP